jgi:hypothetical protein
MNEKKKKIYYYQADFASNNKSISFLFFITDCDDCLDFCSFVKDIFMDT